MTGGDQMTGAGHPTGAAKPWEWRPRWSVRVRLLSAIIAVAALGLTAAGGVTLIAQRQHEVDEVDARLRAAVSAARAVATVETAAGVPAFTSNSAAVQAILGRVIPAADEAAVGIVDGAAAFVPGVPTATALGEDRSFIARVVSEVSDGSVRIGTYLAAGRQLRYIATPVAVVPGQAPVIYVDAIDLDGQTEELVSAIVTYLTTGLIVLVAIGLVGWLVAGRLLDPIRRLGDAAATITASNRTSRIPVVGRDDISRLTVNFNDMLDRLDRALTSQRQLLEDVRHELRTPVTIVRGHLDVLDPGDERQVAITRGVAIRELDRMTRLIEEIESLADSQTAILELRPVDPAAFTRDLFATASGIPDRDWVLGGQAHSPVSMDPGRITQAWLQLVANAAKYSPHGSTITVGSSDLSDGVEFWVADQGSGVPEGARERIFERFGRAETGRGVGGSGLGLAIVRAIVAAHAGRISVESGPAGSRFGIVIPRVEDR